MADSTQDPWQQRYPWQIVRADLDLAHVFMPLSSFRQLLLQEWFERVWVIQEATTPLNVKIVQCGDVTVSWAALVITARFISYVMGRPNLRAYFAATRHLDTQTLRRLFNLEICNSDSSYM